MAKEKENDVEVTIDPERQAKWDAFLAKARLVNPARFDAQKAAGEFDKIPENWNG